MYTIVRCAGLTWKVLERRAIQINMKEVLRFCNELRLYYWSLDSLVFLDEVGFDNRDMLRKRGFAIKGNRLVHRGEFTRKPRESLLCFVGLHGMLDAYHTVGTFDRLKFVDCCKTFALKGNAQCYPGKHSMWILDGAIIHCHPNIVHYLRSLGFVVVFLPAYCPFYNPIEFMFGLVKKNLQNKTVVGSDKKVLLSISKCLFMLQEFNMKAIYRKCGYITDNRFDPSIGLRQQVSSLGFIEN